MVIEDEDVIITKSQDIGSKSQITIRDPRSALTLTLRILYREGRALCAAAVSLLLGRIGRWSERETARSALSLARSAQAERDNKSCFFVHAAGVHRFIRRYHFKKVNDNDDIPGPLSDRRPWACSPHTLIEDGTEGDPYQLPPLDHIQRRELRITSDSVISSRHEQLISRKCVTSLVHAFRIYYR
ncbi:hypothetical protein EVAR_76088_1 [Eumeta japonica]|uniref:Uncharacterized protein n=1 Tax=Eumeta variegata TaxID=151549 RepID=A0A4C1W459_EUMVA|nr:hypothetical protein EVAR_76088_1 [Eumeta japonica]